MAGKYDVKRRKFNGVDFKLLVDVDQYRKAMEDEKSDGYELNLIVGGYKPIGKGDNNSYEDFVGSAYMLKDGTIVDLNLIEFIEDATDVLEEIMDNFEELYED